MTEANLIARYREAAEAAGVEVELVPVGGLAERLRRLAAQERPEAAAVPPEGWPRGLRETVREALAAEGCGIVDAGQNREELARVGLGVTFCARFLADTGSLVLPAGPGMGTLASLLPPVHLALSLSEGVAEGLGQYLAALSGSLPSRLTLVTGPSRTGDIEATMTHGAHGPRRVLHWILS